MRQVEYTQYIFFIRQKFDFALKIVFLFINHWNEITVRDLKPVNNYSWMFSQIHLVYNRLSAKYM